MMWTGNDWDKVHQDVYNYANCGIHKHADLEEMCRGVWEQSGRDMFEKWIRLKVMEPFLFMKSYAFGNCTLWGKAAGLLPKENLISDGRVDQTTKEIILLVDTVAYHLSWILQFLQVLSQSCPQIRSLLIYHKRNAGELLKCCLLDDAAKCIAQNDLYKIFRKYIPLDGHKEKMLVAAFCITFVSWQQLFDKTCQHETPELGTKLNNEQTKQKILGNEEFKDNMFNQAVATYTKIIKEVPDNSIIYGNRANAYLKLGKFNEAEIDGRRLVILDPSNFKGYFRMATAKEGLEEYHSGHQLAALASKLCADAGHAWSQLFDLSVRLQKLCEAKGLCQRDRRIQHQVTVSREKDTSGLPDLVSSEEDSSDDNEELNNGYSVHPVLSPVYAEENNNNTVNSPAKQSISPPKMFQYNLVELLKSLKALQQQGSQALQLGNPQEAVQKYLEALEILPKLAEQNYEPDVEEKVCLKYALGIAYQRGTPEMLLQSLETFQEILSNYSDLNFIPAHSGIGETYVKLFRFEQALEHLTIAQKSVEERKQFRTYNWPGTKDVIEDSIREDLSDKMNELIQCCQYPSVPDAVCRSDYCLLPSKNIYFGDPEFKGYYRLTCEGNCKLEYHSQCWKKVKEPLDGNKKGIVGQVCLTPDCGHIVVGLEKLDHDGNLLSKTGTTGEKDVKPKKSKSEKKTGNKDNKKSKRKERRQPSICEPEDQASSGTVEQPVLEPDNKELVKPALPSYDVNDEPAYVLRKGESPPGDGSLNEKSLSSSNLNVTNIGQNKKKRQKTKKQITLTAQEFCGDILENEETHFSRYLRRVHELQKAKSLVEGDDEDWPALTSNFTLNPDSPFFVPEHLRDNPEALEMVLQKHILSTQQVPYLRQSSEAELTDDSDKTEEIMATVLEYIENFLRANGPMHKDSLFLREEVSCFPESTQALIKQSGGLTHFLKQSDHFVIDGNIISVTPQNNNILSVEEKIKRSGEVVESKRRPENAKEKNIKKNTENVQQKESSTGVERSDSWESNKSNSTSSSALKSIQKLTKSFSNDLQVAMFKLQVSISALGTEDQQQIVCSVINSVKSNLSNDFWTDINPHLESVQVSVKGVESQDQNKISIAEFDRLSEANKNLEERLSSALDTITQLQNTQSFKNSKYEEEITELKATSKKLQLSLNSQQDRIDSERQQLQQERAKVKEEAQNLKKEKDQEVETARHLLAKVMSENDKLKAKLEKERDDNACLKKTITSLMENYEEASVQAQSAKEDLVKLKKREGLKLLDKELESVVKTKAHLLDMKKREQEKPTMSSSHFQVFVEKPLQDCDVYVNSLTDLKNSFLVLVNENLEALQQGKDPPGTELDIPKVPTLPESLQTIRQGTNSLLPTTNYQPSLLGNPIFQMPNSAVSSLSASMGRSMSPDVSSPLHSVSSMTMPNLFQNNIFRTTPAPTSVSSQMFKPEIPNVNSFPTGLANPGLAAMHSQTQPYLSSSGNLMPLFNFPNARSSQLLSTASSQLPLHNFQSLGTDTAVHCTPLLSKNSPSVPLLTQTVSSNTLGQVPVVKSVTSVPSKPIPSVGTTISIPTQSIPQAKPAPLDSKFSFNNLSHVTLPSTLLSTKGARGGPISAPPGMENLPIGYNMPGVPMLKQPPQTKLVVGKVDVPVADPARPPSASTSASAPAPSAPKTSHDKLIRRLQDIHPKMSSAQLQNYIQLLRSQCKSLSGMSIDKLVEEVTALILKNPRLEIPKARVITPVIERSGQTPKKPYSGLDLIEQSATVIKGNQKEPWGGAASSTPAWSGSDDNTCSICLETMAASPDIHQTDCKHRFHFSCIQKWLKRNSKCPICNSHTLLPTEFPPLGS